VTLVAGVIVTGPCAEFVIGVDKMHQSTMLFPDEPAHMIMYGYVPGGRFIVTCEPVADPFELAVHVVACLAYAGDPPVASFNTVEVLPGGPVHSPM
jgi:hypothetical protein